jgi:hypothetical protein
VNSPALQSVLATFPSVSLDELNAHGPRPSHIDRTYVLRVDAAAALLAEIEPDARVLEISAVRSFGYESIRFDPPDLLAFRLAVHKCRRRLRTRTWTYTDSG